MSKFVGGPEEANAIVVLNVPELSAEERRRAALWMRQRAVDEPSMLTRSALLIAAKELEK